jgi:hypothetical protein
LALAAATIALVALLSVVGSALKTVRSASDETLTTTMAQDLFSDIRRQSFDDVVVCSGVDLGSCLPSRNLATFSGAAGNLYYDAQGNGVVDPAKAYFRCQVHFEQLPPTGALSSVRLMFLWPAPSSVTNPVNTNIFLTRVFRAP